MSLNFISLKQTLKLNSFLGTQDIYLIPDKVKTSTFVELVLDFTDQSEKQFILSQSETSLD